MIWQPNYTTESPAHRILCARCLYLYSVGILTLGIVQMFK